MRPARAGSWQFDTQRELVILFGMLALLISGPRRSGRMPGPFALILGRLLPGWLLVAFGLGSMWDALTR